MAKTLGMDLLNHELAIRLGAKQSACIPVSTLSTWDVYSLEANGHEGNTAD
jgi:hypothetical protein